MAYFVFRRAASVANIASGVYSERYLRAGSSFVARWTFAFERRLSIRSLYISSKKASDSSERRNIRGRLVVSAGGCWESMLSLQPLFLAALNYWLFRGSLRLAGDDGREKRGY